MRYNRFEDLPVWQAAIELAVRVFDLTKHSAFKGHYDLKDQLERSAFPFPITLLRDLSAGQQTKQSHFSIFLAAPLVNFAQ